MRVATSSYVMVASIFDDIKLDVGWLCFVMIMSFGGGAICLNYGILRTVESATMASGLPLRLDKGLF
jgi:hypothetical protein